MFPGGGGGAEKRYIGNKWVNNTLDIYFRSYFLPSYILVIRSYVGFLFMASRNCCIYLNWYLRSSYAPCGETYLGPCQTSMIELFSENRELF